MTDRESKIRCNLCEREFASKAELGRILEISSECGVIDRLLYDPSADFPSTEDADGEERNFEVLLGCPDCLTDAFLTKLEGQNED